ncbi:MAG: hypothetical protein QOH81_2794 [Sphingomonadales bacterium]|nr:hypothetical protein [Sphingomonadales bacterium]
MRNEQVAMSPGHGCAVRGTAHLLMVEGFFEPQQAPPPRYARSPSPAKAGEDWMGRASSASSTGTPSRTG